MTRKLTIAALTLFVATAASAQSYCPKGHSKQVMSCAEGSVWDTASQSCVPQVTG